MDVGIILPAEGHINLFYQLFISDINRFGIFSPIKGARGFLWIFLINLAQFLKRVTSDSRSPAP
jgi:hypothetical protein